MADTPQMPALPEPDSYCTHADSHEYDVWNAAQMRAFRAEGVRDALAGVVEALEAGRDALATEAKEYHAAMAGYRPHIHQAMDAEVASVGAVLARVRALATEIQPPQKAD